MNNNIEFGNIIAITYIYVSTLMIDSYLSSLFAALKQARFNIHSFTLILAQPKKLELGCPPHIPQYNSPSAGWASFLCTIISFLRPIRIFSMVYSVFQWAKRENLLGSILPVDWLTHGILIFDWKYTSGA